MRELSTWKISLKFRLTLTYFGLLLLAVLIGVVFILTQNRIARNESRETMNWTQRTATLLELKQSLALLLPEEMSAGLNATSEAVRARTAELRRNAPDAGFSANLEHFLTSFDSYVASVRAQNPRESRQALLESQAALESVLERNEYFRYVLSDEMNVKRQRAFQLALGLASIFLLALAGMGYLLIGLITKPLRHFIQFVDQVDLEAELPPRMLYESGISELSLLGKSFDRLLMRLRGYRLLNLKRLLAEKRRADVIAASISDGILLLRGGEVVYMNSVGERVLGIGPMPLWSDHGSDRIKLPQLLEREAGNLNAIRAVLAAVEQPMPVEVSVGIGDAKRHYLIQANRLSLEAISGVEQSSEVPLPHLPEQFQADLLIVAQDVTLVKEGQDAKSHFLATLSHEIKTPVTSLTMAIRLLEKMTDENTPQVNKNLIRTCVSDLDRLRTLIDDFLTNSRFDTLTQKMEFKNMDFAKLTRHTLQSFQEYADEKKVQLKMSILGERKPILLPIDPAKITWALSNLLSNAIRHSPSGGVVEVSLESGEGRIEVRVADRGPGMDKARQARIFEKFSQYYDIRVARSGSMGVGLAVAREIITAHGGRIWVSSEPGSGAVFHFTLPLMRSGEQGLIGMTEGVVHGANTRR